MIKKVFKYLEPMWLGFDKQISVRRVLAIVFSLDLMFNLHGVIEAFSETNSFVGAELLIGIEAGLITALLGLTTWSSVAVKK